MGISILAMDWGRWQLAAGEAHQWHWAFGWLGSGMAVVGLEGFGDSWWGLEMATVRLGDGHG